jgi:hypothetical protein
MRANDERNIDGHINDERNEDEVGPNSAVQSGDMQGISNEAGADSESVEELLEEGNFYEAEVVEGVENAKAPDVSEVTTRQVPEHDVPEEYRNDGGKVA